MRITLLALLPFALATPAHADPLCETLMAFIHDVPLNAVATKVVPDRAGPQTVSQVGLPGARCLVASYNPTGVGTKPEQSVNCFWSASEDVYLKLFSDTNERVAACMGQTVHDSAFVTRLEYDTNYGVVRVAADQMTNDWAISVAVMPLN